ncbi:hypothetical protein LUZ60_006384 [Juncus effusus]|nr:hypothetical protein LUZ60_006384 [Juncus effusus]
MTNLTIQTDDSFATLLELAANDDLPALQRYISQNPASADEPGLWYSRRKLLEPRTPLMVASTYGSLNTLSFLLSLPSVDPNRHCGSDSTTALHCAASGGSSSAPDSVRLLLSAGADPDALDSNSKRPADIITVSPNLFDVKSSLEELLGCPPKTESPVSTPKKEYPIDPSLPDIKNSIYASDEFRMYSFKIRPCSRAYSHDWTECPFVHPGENARRRDPRKFHYSCVPCPDFRKGACRRADMCEYAHGVFECWLHPAQYRTRLCKDGTSCNRRVCFFAHANEELRPVYVGSGVGSPRADVCVAGLGSPSFTPPMSPNGFGLVPLSVPALHLPGSSLQLSRLRSSLSARDMMMNGDDISMMQHEFDQVNEMCFSAGRLGSGRSVWGKTLNPSNLDDLFSAEMNMNPSSPRYSNNNNGININNNNNGNNNNNNGEQNMYSPSHKAAFLNQFQQQRQSLLSPINTGSIYQPSLGIQSPNRMSPHGAMDNNPVSPINSHLAAALAQREKQNFRSLSSRDLGSGSSRLAGLIGSPGTGTGTGNWGKWSGTGTGTVDWGVDGEELGKLRRSSSFELRSNGEEPDLSWVNSLVKEPNFEARIGIGTGTGTELNGRENGNNDDGNNHEEVLSAWIEQMQLDQAVV